MLGVGTAKAEFKKALGNPSLVHFPSSNVKMQGIISYLSGKLLTFIMKIKTLLYHKREIWG